MGDKNPKKAPKKKKQVEKVNRNLHTMGAQETENHGKTKKTY